MRWIFHIDFNSYFATVEQQANPRLRGKPIGVTGGDRLERTVLGAASVEAKKKGVKTGMPIWQARQLCPEIILVKGDSDKYLECTKRFINILKDYTPFVEVFSIDECFLELSQVSWEMSSRAGFAGERSQDLNLEISPYGRNDIEIVSQLLTLATGIKQRIKKEVGEWITCSIGISYNKLMAKLAGSLHKPDGLVAVLDAEAAEFILDRVELDDVCGIGPRIKKRLNNMGIFNFKELREVPLEYLLASFKSYGRILYDMARGVDHSPVVPFYEKEEVKSVGHRHTLNHDTNDPVEIKQVLLKLTELVARRMRAKKLVGKTVTVGYRSAFNRQYYELSGHKFFGETMQATCFYTNDGLDIFKAAWRIFLQIWDQEAIRMISISVSNLKAERPGNMSLLFEDHRREIITQALDSINNRYGEFTLQRGILLNSGRVERRPNPFLSDRRFKL